MKQLTFFSLIFLSLSAFGEIPDGYYNKAAGKTGYELKTALYNIISSHTTKSYSSIWSFAISNDLDSYYENDGTILDIYSENPDGDDPYNFTKSTDQCGSNYSSEGDCYNREHSFPKSWFGKASPMVTDVHHIYPTDAVVNNYRGNYPLGEVGTATYTSSNGSKLGASEASTGYSGTVFEPIDEFKGDLARSYFYMATCYENVVGNWESNSTESDAVLDGSSDKVFEDWALNLLLEWNKTDPVSQKEIDRNDAIYSFQGNRNPFVDHPEYVDSIWGLSSSDTTSDSDSADKEIDEEEEVPCREVFFPTSEDKPMWTEQITYTDGMTETYETVIYGMIGTSEIDGKEYSNLYQLQSGVLSLTGAEYVGAIRLDSCGKVYFDNDVYNIVLYDFSPEVGDTLDMSIIGYTNLYFDSITSTLLNNATYLKFVFPEDRNIVSWIEGIGSEAGILAPLKVRPTATDENHKLLCYYEGGELIYNDCDGDCFPESTSGLNQTEESRLSVFPNPAIDGITLNLSEVNYYKIYVYDFNGRVLLESRFYGSSNYLSLKTINNGIYMLRVCGDGDANWQQKLIVMR